MPLIPHKRAFLARRLRDVGLLALAERLARRPGLLVLTYHRIGDPSARPYYAPVASASAEALGEELRALARTHRVLSLEECLALADRDFRAERPVALVTFDDGYRDNVEAALPVLTSLGVPATFFLPTGFFERPRLPWWDRVAFVINATAVPVLRLERPEPLEIDLGRTSRPEAIARVVRAYLDHPEADEPACLAALGERAEVEVDDEVLGRELFMTWDQARALLDAGMSVGSHAHSHRALGHLSEDDQRAELTRSKATLERELGREVVAVAYPYGWPGTYSDATLRAARDAGYRLGFSSIEGVNRPGATDRLAARRLGVGFADPPVLHRARWALFETFGRSVL
jgi:peptidoglycan/xylan/chitin deacetylase (PgdA/CDA1 family)